MVKLIILFLIMYKKILLFALILLASCSKKAEKEKEVIIEPRVFERKVGYVLFYLSCAHTTNPEHGSVLLVP